MVWTAIESLGINPLYLAWLCFTGAGCLALALLHTGEEDYLDHDEEDDIW